MNRIKIVPKRRAISLIAKLSGSYPVVYYLCDDYAQLIDLRKEFAGEIEIRNLAGIFQQTFEEIQNPFIEMLGKLNKRYSSDWWWSGQLASKSTSALPLGLNITYLFCAKKILEDARENVLFIVESRALAHCISTLGKKQGYRVTLHWTRIMVCREKVRAYAYYAAQILYFFWQLFQNCRTARKLPKPFEDRKTKPKKRIVLRTWVTKGSFDKTGAFQERNFGMLPDWLKSKGYEVLTLPMFFNMKMKGRSVYAPMKNQKQQFLIPEHYLRLTDYVDVLHDSYRRLRLRINDARIAGIDVAPLFNEVIKDAEFDVSLAIMNLCYPMLKRLEACKFEIDAFYYPFENNAPEKQFMLGCRRFFPHAKIIGFQHTAVYQSLPTFDLSPLEWDCHPLPDKIICSGKIYLKLLEERGFPSELLCSGPNLRYENVHAEANREGKRRDSRGNENALLVALTYSENLAFDLLAKVAGALKGVEDYRLIVRSHPLISEENIRRFLDRLGMRGCEVADSGSIQDWFRKCEAVLSSGASITIIEAVVAGTPVIRVRPDNFFFYDPFFEDDYPLPPVDSSADIRKQIQLVEKMTREDKDVFLKIGQTVMRKYFTRPSDQNLRVFL